MRKTKIVCTIGPASESEAVLSRLIDSGMNVARLNFSHGNHEDHGKVIDHIRSLSDENEMPVAILQDLAGPKIRIGSFEQGSIHVQSGARFVLTTEDVPGDEQRVSVTYDKLPEEVEANSRILLADGTIELVVKETREREVICEVVVGGELSSNKGINLPGSSLSVKAFTQKDRDDLVFGLQRGVDMAALSFVRRAEDIEQVRSFMEEHGRVVPIIAKIEKHEAVEQIDEIIEATDGIMVARGDLAVETALERVPLVQKMLIQKCNRAGKPVITATQMLKSMVDNPRPTRAEANDVANAVLDGTDAVMLSEETAVGQYPVDALRIMARILQSTESSKVAELKRLGQEHAPPTSVAHAVSRGAFEIAKDLEAAAILAPTQSGSTARKLSSYRPSQPIIALSPDPLVMRCLSLVWGVHPLLAGEYANSDEMIAQAKDAALKSGLVNRGDLVVITAGIPVGIAGTTNLIKVETLD